MNNDLIAAFNQFFELVHADTDELRMQVYLLRFQVYVVETGFETESDCHRGADERGNTLLWEQDVFDERADHYLLRHRRTGMFAATARLILPSPIDVAAPYPIELHCPLDFSVTDTSVRTRLGEISRFAVSKVFKRRIGELGSLAGVADDVEIYLEEDERRVLPHISLGLIAEVMRMVHEHRITHCYAVMEPALLRLLSRFGMVFNRIGPDVDYHGIRVPCITTAEEALPNIKKIAPSVWNLITERGQLLHEAA
jgi:N-acyl amino acid synthase of PEP-CTERM/exosortase system